MLVKVVKGGRELTISENAIGEYLKQGYSLIDKNGNLIEKGVPLTYEAAMKERNHLLARVKELEAELATQRKPRKTKSE